MSSTGVSRIAGIDPFTSFKAPCTVATTANITLSGAQTVDGVAVAETTPKTRVLVKDQTDQTENGIYDVYDTSWVRSDDFNGTRDATKGTMINIQSGTSWTGVTFRLTTTGTVVFGTSSITFESANPANSTTVIGKATLDTYAELMAINTGQYSNGDIIYLAGSGIAGSFRLVNSVAHGITSTTGVQIRINDDWYAQRVYEDVIKDVWFEVAADDSTDNATKYQAMHDALTNGGKIVIHPAAAAKRISVVDITNENITVALMPGATIKKHGSGGASARGIFRIQNLLNANFLLIGGGTVDLNGEGPQDIGVSGRIANIVGQLNDIGLNDAYGLAGPLNSAIFTLRASHISVIGPTIKNTGECGLIFRNSANIEVQKCHFENCANFGVEFSLVDSGSDGGTGDLPDNIGDYKVHHCTFKNIDDFGLGGGNGTGVGGGGSSTAAHKNIHIHNNDFDSCTRTIHFEFNSGGYIDQFEINNNNDKNARQGFIGTVGARNGHIHHNVGINPSSGPYNALNAFNQASPVEGDYVSSHGIILSTDTNRVKVDHNIIVDNREETTVTGTDGAITAGDKTFTSAAASFVVGDIGKWIGIQNAVSSSPSVSLVARITSINSSTSVEIDVNAANTVSSTKYVYGSALRRGFDMNGGVSCDVQDNTFDCGNHTGLTNEPVAAAAYFQNPTGTCTFKNNRGAAPGGSATAQAGFRVSDTISGTIIYSGNRFTGFDENYENVDAIRASMIMGTVSERLGTSATPDAAANTYGAAVTHNPNSDYFEIIPDCSVTFANLGSETVTARVIFYRFDGVSNSQTLATSSDTTSEFTTSALTDLHTDRAPVRAITLELQSTITSSTATAKLNYLARENT